MTTEDGYSSVLDSMACMGSEGSLFSAFTAHFVVERDPKTKKLKPETMRLYDDTARMYHEMATVSFVWSVANELEGKKKFPRPFIYEKSDNPEIADKLISTGDKLAILYGNGSIYTPLVIGSIECIGAPRQHKFLFIDQDNLERQPERYENADYLLEALNDGKGEFTYTIKAKAKDSAAKNDGGTGNITMELIGQKDAGKVTLNTNGVVSLNQKDADGAIIQSIVLDNTADAETVTITDKSGNKIESSKSGFKITGQKDKKSEHLVYGETLVTTLKSIISAILKSKVMTPTGLSGAIQEFPTNYKAFTDIDNALDEILTL